MSVTSGKTRPSLTQEILSHLGLANKTAAWGTLGTLRTFLSFSVDKDVQRLLRAIAGQGFKSNEAGGSLPLKTLLGPGELIAQPSSGFRCGLQCHHGRVDQQDQRAKAAHLSSLPGAHPADFQVEAEEDIKSETSDILQELLLALAKGVRDRYSGIIDYNLVEQDVQALKQAEAPSTEGTWVLIFTQRNLEHLIRVFDQYQRCTGHELEKTVQNRFHGDAQAALLSLASVIKNTPLYFADKLHQALQDIKPNYQVLMRILISRSETDLLSIRAEFKKKFGKSLYSSLQDAVKGDCRSALLALCRGEDI
ncbi:annexin A9 isoform X6 [Vulpes vulpes]|uniref:Annexin A9 isoform X6 n=1 Tax=Vulpes vulpes TaxID=9627 RepID=A0ABM5B6N9_VULVU|nr:annexin A9 isoform X3 [Vulpes vulpes]